MFVYLQCIFVFSAMLLADVMRPPFFPVPLLIAVYRVVEVQTSPFLRSFLMVDISRFHRSYAF